MSRITLPDSIPFDYQYLMQVLKDYASPRNKINLMLRNKELIRIKKGLYVSSLENADPFVLACLIYGPSYVSLESALSYWGLIPERASTVTCVTNKRNKLFSTPAGRFSYRYLENSAFSIGADIVSGSSGSFFIATPEKALCDRTSLARRLRQRDVEKFLSEELRIELENLRLDFGRLENIGSHYRNRSIQSLIGWYISNMREGLKMDAALLNMLGRYNCRNAQDYENAMKEIIQHLALLGLWRSKFFEHAAFYGGSALRIFHGSRRFSEDLGFSLVRKDNSFDLSPYVKMVETELLSFGFKVEVIRRSKQHSDIDSAFIKANTLENMFKMQVPEAVSGRIQKNKILKVKFEVDTTPPGGASYEGKTLLMPIPFQVELFTPPCLFAGKLHAILCRSWQTRVKGRDFYDFVWFIGNEVPCDIGHLRLRMIDSGHLAEKDKFGHGELLERLRNRFDTMDFRQAKEDVEPFITDPAELTLWNSSFFNGLLARLKCIQQEIS